MRYIEEVSVPAIGPAGVEQCTTRDLIKHMVRFGQRFSNHFDGIRLGLRLHEACEAKGPIVLESADWQALCDDLKTPSPVNGAPACYPLSPAHLCVPLIESVINATTKPPTAKRR